MSWPDRQSRDTEEPLLPVHEARVGNAIESTNSAHFTTSPQPANNARFEQRDSVPLGRVKSSRQGSYSSVDTADLMDHRELLNMGAAGGSRIPAPGSFISRRRRSSTEPLGNFMGKNIVADGPPGRGNSFNSTTFVDKLLKRGRTNSKAPLLHYRDDLLTEYQAISEGMGESSMNRARDALAIDIENMGTDGIRRGSRLSGLQLSGQERNPNLSRLLDDSDASEILGSEPLSRRSLSVSSLGDVCLPVDSMGRVSTSSRDTSFHLSYLEEFAVNERNEFLAIQKSAPAESIYNVGSKQGSGPVGSGVNVLLSHKVNEVEDGGRLRPYRVVPWSDSNGSRTQSPFLAQPKSTHLKSRFNKRSHYENPDSTGRKARKGQYESIPFSGGYEPAIEEGPMLRFTYFREDLDATVHSPSISGLLQPGQTFDDLFNVGTYASRSGGTTSGVHSDANSTRNVNLNADPAPEPVHNATELSNGTLAQEELPLAEPQPEPYVDPTRKLKQTSTAPASGYATPTNYEVGTPPLSQASSIPAAVLRDPSVGRPLSTMPQMPPAVLDPSPFWLDILNPTEEEMKVLSKTFGIHPLTTEDIFLGETREKVELFRNYYLVCFRSFDVHDERSKRQSQSAHAEDSGRDRFRRRMSGAGTNKSDSTRRRKNRPSSELTPLNMYIIVFHEGVLTFHFSPTPHPMNVRRRARLLRDYITVSSDWISYALIDDITDGFAPMIEAIDEEVTYIEDSILRMHSSISSDSEDSSDDESEEEVELNSKKGSFRNSFSASRKTSSFRTKSNTTASSQSSVSTRDEKWKEKGDMLRRIGECRKRVMSILRLLGSKADVIKGFSKRCNEQWEVAPRSEIGLYLGDIQDHIVTMVQSLNHYEKLLARSHSNYLAQINIDMTRVNNDMNDVLSRITVMGTIVLPLNIVTGLWGMNVIVPGQDIQSLTWFWSITGSLILFALACFFLARRVYNIA